MKKSNKIQVAYVRVKDSNRAKVAQRDPLDDGSINVDYDAKGRVIGIEFLRVNFISVQDASGNTKVLKA